MFPKLFSILTVSLLLSFSAHAEVSKIQSQMIDTTVQVETKDGFCSGSILSSKMDEKTKKVSTYILSAKHCFNKVDEFVSIIMTDYTENGLHEIGVSTFFGRVDTMSDKTDIALVKLMNEVRIFPNTVKIGTEEDLSFGMKTWLVGFPAGKSTSFTEGTLGRIESADPGMPTAGVEFQRSSASMATGSSGGPLFVKNKDGDYVQIGISSAQYTGLDFINLFVTTKDIIEFLKKNEKGK